MEKLSRKIAEAIGKNLGKTDEEVAVIAYGMTGIIQFSAIFLFSSIVGILFGFWIESAVVFLSVGFLRRLTGGAHSSGIYSCLIYSVLFVSGISALSVYVLPLLEWYVNVILCGAVFLYGYVMVALKAPVSPPNKPCRTEAKRKRLRKGAFIVLTLFLITVITFILCRDLCGRLYSVGIALAISTLWQIVMMTRAGHAFVDFVDGLFSSRK
jgi:accessory gene regulator B